MPLLSPGQSPFELFQQALQAQDRSPLTGRAYLADLQRFAAWMEATYSEPFSLPLISARDIAGYKNHLQSEKGLKPQTINRKLAAMSTFCRWDIKEGLLTQDPTALIKGVKETRLAPKALDTAQQNRLLRAVEKPRTQDVFKRPWRDIAILTLLLHTGLRVAELCALKRSDLALSERKGAVTVRAGKGRRYREIPLNADCRKALREYLIPLEDGSRGSDGDDFLFRSQKGGGMSPSAVWRAVKRVGKDAGIDLSPHTLRHSFGTSLVRGGTDLVSVAALLGHESLNTTAIYTQPSQHHLEHVVQKLSRLENNED